MDFKDKDKEKKEPTQKEKLDTEMALLRAHPDSASLSVSHIIKVLELLAATVK